MEIRLQPDRDALFDAFGLQRLRDSYMLPEEKSPQERFAYVAGRLGSNGEHAQRIYDYASKHWLSFATPILSLGRAKHGLPISCYLSYLDDTSRGLLDTLTEANELSMLGGGVGIGVHLRSADEKSTGVMPHMNTYDASSLAYKQDGVRRGSYAMYLDINHPEIIPFLEMRKSTGDHNVRCHNLHHAINVSDEFMRLVKRCAENGRGEDDSWPLVDPHTKRVKKVVSARMLWQRILEMRIRTGEPYLCFVDTCNAAMPAFQREKGLKISQSNLCVAGETTILTDNGHIRIDELEGERVNVWNGREFSSVVVVKTGVNRELMRIACSNGASLRCTPYHTFILANGKRVSASELTVGTKLLKWNAPVLRGDPGNDIDHPYTHGFFCGNGSYGGENYSNPRITLYGEKKRLIPFLNIESTSGVETVNCRLYNDIPRKFFVPRTSSIDCRLKWLAGYLDADGCVCANGSNEELRVSSINVAFLSQIREMLQTLGVQSSVVNPIDRREISSHPRNGSYGEETRQKIWRLLISSNGLYRLTALGFKTQRLVWTMRLPQPNAEGFDVVSTITAAVGVGDTYCFNEPLEHAGVFNGILTGQCSEITLPTDKDRTAVCCLSSVNLERYDEWRNDASFVRDVCEMLDNALTMFIDEAPDTIKRAKYSAQRERSIGIGALGWHAYLQSKNVPIESDEARRLNVAIFSSLADEIEAATYALGAERGEPDDAVGTGRRFCCTRAIAPNATSSIIMGNTSPSIEPFRANAYCQDTLSGSFLNKNRYLDALLERKRVDAESVWRDIVLNAGSVQHLDCLSDHEKSVFKTAFEIDQRALLQLAADRQPFIDQSQSLNLFLPPDVNVATLHSLHLDAWLLGLKSLYYVRSTKVVQVDKLKPSHDKPKVCARRKPGASKEEACLACE